MTLGLFLSLGESLNGLEQKGQLARLLNYNLKYYCRNFKKVYLFTYAKSEKIDLPENCRLVTNSRNLPRYLYSILLPIIHISKIKECSVLRGLQVTGGIPCLLSKIILGKKFIINYGYNYSKVAKLEGKNLQSFFFPTVSKIVLALCDKVIITAGYLKKYIPQDKSVLIPNGVDLKLFKPSGKVKEQIIFVGRLESQKNVDLLIKAFTLVKSKNAKLIIIGDGSKKDELVKLGQKLKTKIEFPGAINYLKLAKIMSRSQIFILPSKVEGNPKSLIEAMACGCAPIGTNVEGINNIIENRQNGILVAPNEEQISGAIKALLKDQNLIKKIGNNARKFSQMYYDIDKLLKREIALLKDVGNGRI